MMNISGIGSNAYVTINGKSYSGSNISISNNKILVDGKECPEFELEKAITINITGDVKSVQTSSGNVDVVGNVLDSVKTVSGDINCDSVAGSITTVSGDVRCCLVNGNIKTVSGDITHE